MSKVSIDTNNHKCEKCNKEFSSQHSLNTHLRTSKKCSNALNTLIIKSKELSCDWCKKLFSSKQMLLYHDTICKIKQSREIERLRSEIEILKLKWNA